MNYELLYNRILRLPMHKAAKLVEEYQQKVGFKNFAEQQKVLDILAHKSNTQRQIKKEAFDEAFIHNITEINITLHKGIVSAD